MRHFDAWLLRDPYSIFHYYSTGRRWQETVRDLIQQRRICAPSMEPAPDTTPVDPYATPIDPQSHSPFFQKLPPEIRLMIYRYAFGDEAVHLVQVKDKIRHVRCQHTSSSLDRNRRCCPETLARWRTPSHVPDKTNPTTDTANANAMLYPHSHPALPAHLSNSSLALLRVCRAIYAEAADMLYASVAFDVDDLHTFIAFSHSVCPRRLASIHRLTVQYSPVWQPMAGLSHSSSIYAHTHNDHLWTLFWSRVAALRGLQSLHLSLDLGHYSAPVPVPGAPANNTNGTPLLLSNGGKLRLAIDEPWVSPLLCVRGLHDFELGITARCDPSAKHLLETNLCRDAVTLRDQLRGILCSPAPALPASFESLVESDVNAKQDEAAAATAAALAAALPMLSQLAASRCAREEERELELRRVRPRLAITAA